MKVSSHSKSSLKAHSKSKAQKIKKVTITTLPPALLQGNPVPTRVLLHWKAGDRATQIPHHRVGEAKKPTAPPLSPLATTNGVPSVSVQWVIQLQILLCGSNLQGHSQLLVPLPTVSVSSRRGEVMFYHCLRDQNTWEGGSRWCEGRKEECWGEAQYKGAWLNRKPLGIRHNLLLRLSSKNSKN